MRPDQMNKLRAMSEHLADVFLYEADPENWTGGGVAPRDMTKEERGNRHWDKKNAMATGGVLTYTLNLIKHHEVPSGGNEPGEQAERESDLDKKINEAEKRAEAAVARVMQRAKGGRHPAGRQ